MIGNFFLLGVPEDVVEEIAEEAVKRAECRVISEEK